MPRRKIITRVIVFLLLGAIVNVAVAWGCAYRIPSTEMKQEAPPDAAELRELMASQKAVDWEKFAPNPDDTFRDESLGIAIISCFDFSEVRSIREMAKEKEFEHNQTELEAAADTTRAWITRDGPILKCIAVGWPSLCLRGFVAKQSREITRRQDGVFEWRARHFPIIPSLRGFAINTIFYAAILWLLFFAPGSVRRTLRRRCGLCPACAYPVGTSPVCTECGKPVTPKSVVSP